MANTQEFYVLLLSYGLSFVFLWFGMKGIKFFGVLSGMILALIGGHLIINGTNTLELSHTLIKVLGFTTIGAGFFLLVMSGWEYIKSSGYL